MTMAEANWYALSIKSRHEFVVSGELRRKGIETFLPSVTKLSRWKDRKKLVELPLFPGYLFVYIAPDPEEFLRVVKTRGTVTLIALEPGRPTPVAPEEIRSLKRVLESGEKLDIYPHFQTGSRVRVKRGLLQGAEGVLAKKEDQDVFLVSIELLGRSVGVKMSADDVEAA
jgi:transcriptional antiterminator NusG